MIITFTLTVEAIGAVLLGIYFVPEYGMMGVFISVFLAVSAFCNAGFDNLGFLGEYTSLTTFNDNYLVIFTIMALIVIGGLGFVVWNDLMAYRKTRVLLLHTKIVLMVTIFLILFGALGYLGLEWDNEKTMQALDMKGKIGAAFMQSITMRTAGFNSIDLYSMTDAAKVFSVVLMFIGRGAGFHRRRYQGHHHRGHHHDSCLDYPRTGGAIYAQTPHRGQCGIPVAGHYVPGRCCRGRHHHDFDGYQSPGAERPDRTGCHL